MESTDTVLPIVRTGDLDGLGRVYSEWGGLISKTGEAVLGTGEGWEMNVRSPWRAVLPKTIFLGFGGKSTAKIYVTTQRIVLVREIDVWRELKDELSPLGVPAAAAKEIQLRRLKSAGARQYCEIRPRELRVVKAKRVDRHSSWLDFRLIGTDGRQYAITIWKTDGLDNEILNLVQSRFST